MLPLGLNVSIGGPGRLASQGSLQRGFPLEPRCLAVGRGKPSVPPLPAPVACANTREEEVPPGSAPGRGEKEVRNLFVPARTRATGTCCAVSGRTRSRSGRRARLTPVPTPGDTQSRLFAPHPLAAPSGLSAKAFQPNDRTFQLSWQAGACTPLHLCCAQGTGPGRASLLLPHLRLRPA